MDNDSLWIGVQSLQGSCITTLNIFRKVRNGFELVKIIEGEEALRVYDILTKGDDEGVKEPL